MESQSNFFFLIAYLNFFLSTRLYLQGNETEDQEVGSQDGIVDAWYEGYQIGWFLGYHLGSSLYLYLIFFS